MRTSLRCVCCRQPHREKQEVTVVEVRRMLSPGAGEEHVMREGHMAFPGRWQHPIFLPDWWLHGRSLCNCSVDSAFVFYTRFGMCALLHTRKIF